ncbi:PREDICTED: uncharacterized protein LOC104586535 [Nelumbo nucifera]|uniref:Uncharacterized protein n=2 Tax=Nelumbo nucifera TaxID=4432 RepID=A0A822ZG29_NELNU|nr:PREDICTED: uncharacterized protein LOC104586535 [Nelumbo nucifera]DAD43837.1 TPA_asm: hypothetical protein HUJ06_002067 [Nelumbo nucifera]
MSFAPLLSTNLTLFPNLTGGGDCTTITAGDKQSSPAAESTSGVVFFASLLLCTSFLPSKLTLMVLYVVIHPAAAIAQPSPPATNNHHQALSHPKWADEVLDGSLRLLDICGTTRDVLSQLKESLQQLESSLRRKRSGESGLATQVGAYMTFRKKINKTIHKCLADLKKMEKHTSFALFISKDLDLVAIVNVLKEVEAITVSVFQSVLSFVSGPKAQSKPSGWSLVSKSMQPKRIACEREEEDGCSEMEKLDGALYALINCQKSCMGGGVLQNAQPEPIPLPRAPSTRR